MIATKASKIDTEMCLRWVDLLHKMVNQVMLLMTLKCKSDLEQIGGESNNVKQNRKVQLLHQSLLISKWIESFDSQNINDFYFQTDKEHNPEMIQAVQFQFKNALNEIEGTQLSPNLKAINVQLQETKNRLDLTKNAELNESQSVRFNAFSPSKRLKLNPSQEKFELHNSNQIMAATSDRYGKFASTARNKSSKSGLQGQKGHPPKLSPRATNRSVDPVHRKQNLMGKTSPTGDQSLSWGNTNSLNFGGKKQSMPVNNPNDVNYQGLTSKYSFNVDNEGNYVEPGSNLTSKKLTKTLKFKDDSPTLTQSRNSGDLIDAKKISALKPTLNDSSSK